MIVEAIVPEQEDSSWLQHLKATFYISTCKTRPVSADNKYQLEIIDTKLPKVFARLPSHTQVRFVVTFTHTHQEKTEACQAYLEIFVLYRGKKKIHIS